MNSNNENLDAGSRAKDKPALPMGEVIQIDQTLVQKHLSEVVRATVEETLNAMLEVTEAPVENQLVGVVFKSSSIAVEANLTVTFSVKEIAPQG